MPQKTIVRYFAELAYNGAEYFGWQRQPNGNTVQETIENALSTILNVPTAVTGCGRTDTGVHASQYFLHFDFDGSMPANFLFRLNRFLPADITFRRIFEVHSEAHARFDATRRGYCYYLSFRKDPFHINTRYHYPMGIRLNIPAMQQAANLLLEFEEFFPFCKTGHDAKTMKCQLYRSEWVYHEQKGELHFHISANRFLRGMVRLIVGMSVNVGLQKLTLEEVTTALQNQNRLSQSLSVSPAGLFLTEVAYPEAIIR